MIKLQRPPEPQKLIDNKTAWQASLDAAILRHGSYTQIPKDERGKLISHYKDKEITEPLFESSHGKCAYCECNVTESSYLEVEHYKPKSIYPEKVFDWENFLPSCSPCNKTKGTHDTGIAPIINPYITNPDDAFLYKRIQIKPKEGVHFEAAERTIDVCRLNSPRLIDARAKIMPKLELSSMALEDAIKKYNATASDTEKQSIKRNIQEALSTADLTQEDSAVYAGFCRNFFKNDDIYNKAKELISA
ncbi:hypothetical protein FACS189483_08610 [Spirochaetia bacterium]|nr:hypothetical protein FACS189483_08610 [Spirochaetia bacterium]